MLYFKPFRYPALKVSIMDNSPNLEKVTRPPLRYELHVISGNEEKSQA